MNTRRYPRTLNEAFGPYASGPIEDRPSPLPSADKIVLVASILAVIALICLVALGWLPGSQA